MEYHGISSTIWGYWLEHSAFIQELAQVDSLPPTHINYFVNGENPSPLGETGDIGRATWKGLMAGYDHNHLAHLTGRTTITLHEQQGHAPGKMDFMFHDITGGKAYDDIEFRITLSSLGGIRFGNGEYGEHGFTGRMQAAFYGAKEEIAGVFSLQNPQVGPNVALGSVLNISGAFAAER